MSIVTVNKYKILFILGLMVLTSVFFFFYRMYQNDMRSLTNFVASYEIFDKATLDFSASMTNDTEQKAQDALTELKIKANFSLSSLIKNDNVVPPLALEIADLSRQELASLEIYKKSTLTKNTDSGDLAKEYNDLISKRKTAYATFQKFAELKD